MTRIDPNADERQDGSRRSGRSTEDDARDLCADAARRSSRRDCQYGALLVQRSCELHHRPVDLGRWRIRDALSRKAAVMERRDFVKASAALLTASVWSNGLALAKEMNMPDSKKIVPP